MVQRSIMAARTNAEIRLVGIGITDVYNPTCGRSFVRKSHHMFSDLRSIRSDEAWQVEDGSPSEFAELVAFS